MHRDPGGHLPELSRAQTPAGMSSPGHNLLRQVLLLSFHQGGKPDAWDSGMPRTKARYSMEVDCSVCPFFGFLGHTQ